PREQVRSCRHFIMNAKHLKEDVLRSSSSQFLITVQSGLRQIWAHKFRSLLTMLGIILEASALLRCPDLAAEWRKARERRLLRFEVWKRCASKPRNCQLSSVTSPNKQ